jgi:hypothetical protein
MIIGPCLNHGRHDWEESIGTPASPHNDHWVCKNCGVKAVGGDKWAVNNITLDGDQIDFDSNQVVINGNLTINGSVSCTDLDASYSRQESYPQPPPNYGTDSGESGEMRFGKNHLYVCTGNWETEGHWKRIPFQSFNYQSEDKTIPISPQDSGNLGEVRSDDNYLYYHDGYQWRRAQLDSDWI